MNDLFSPLAANSDLTWVPYPPGEIAHVGKHWYVFRDYVSSEDRVRYKIGRWIGGERMWNTPFMDGGFALKHGWDKGWEASEPCLSLRHALVKIERWEAWLQPSLTANRPTETLNPVERYGAVVELDRGETRQTLSVHVAADVQDELALQLESFPTIAIHQVLTVRLREWLARIEALRQVCFLHSGGIVEKAAGEPYPEPDGDAQTSMTLPEDRMSFEVPADLADRALAACYWRGTRLSWVIGDLVAEAALELEEWTGDTEAVDAVVRRGA